MLASTEVLLIEILFCLGALIALGGLGVLIWTKRHHRGFRPAMAIIVCGVGVVIIASLLNVLLFRTYAGVRVKKNQYYEITSLTTNMHASLASSQAPNQPVSPQAKKASKNVTYLVDNMAQPAASKQLAQTAETQLTTKQQPNVALVRGAYREILQRYFTMITTSTKARQKLDQHTYRVVTQHPRKP